MEAEHRPEYIKNGIIILLAGGMVYIVYEHNIAPGLKLDPNSNSLSVRPENANDLQMKIVEDGAIEMPDGEIIYPTNTYKTNTLTGAVFKIVVISDLPNKECLEIGQYTHENKQDLVGALVALGPDAGLYNDVNNTTAFWPDGGNTTFSRDKLPDSQQFHNVPPGTVVCDKTE